MRTFDLDLDNTAVRVAALASVTGFTLVTFMYFSRRHSTLSTAAYSYCRSYVAYHQVMRSFPPGLSRAVRADAIFREGRTNRSGFCARSLVITRHTDARHRK